MTPRAFSRYMIALGMGTHPKLARLTDSEFRAHVVGILAVAAMAPVRGRLLVGDLPAEPVDIAAAAGVPEKVAASAMRKLMAVGVLRPDEEHDCLRVHDWDDVNPSPGAERTRRWRDGNASPERHTSVTDNGTNGHTSVTGSSPEVKKEKKKPASQVNDTVERGSTAREIFVYWQQRCEHPSAKLTSDRRTKIEARLREGYTGEQLREAIDGAARGAFVNESGKRFDDIELICRSGSKLESFISRPDARSAPVRPVSRREQVVADQNAYLQYYPDQGAA